MVDVDGVISLFGFGPRDRPAGRFLLVDGIPHYLSATAGEHLRALGREFALVWCTGWEEKADDYLPHGLGLPERPPHLTFGRAVARANVHWKLGAIDAYAGSRRSLAWIDDTHDEHCRRWAAERAAPTLLVGTDPAIGLTAEQVGELLAWASGLKVAGPGQRSALMPAASSRVRQ
jgi:hypothetical protein